jgi:hypothetical protein
VFVGLPAACCWFFGSVIWAYLFKPFLMRIQSLAMTSNTAVLQRKPLNEWKELEEVTKELVEIIGQQVLSALGYANMLRLATIEDAETIAAIHGHSSRFSMSIGSRNFTIRQSCFVGSSIQSSGPVFASIAALSPWRSWNACFAVRPRR